MHQKGNIHGLTIIYNRCVVSSEWGTLFFTSYPASKLRLCEENAVPLHNPHGWCLSIISSYISTSLSPAEMCFFNDSITSSNILSSGSHCYISSSSAANGMSLGSLFCNKLCVMVSLLSPSLSDSGKNISLLDIL